MLSGNMIRMSLAGVEMNEGKMELGQTSAGKEVTSQLIKQQEMFQRQLLQIKEEQEEAAKKADEKNKVELARDREMWEKRLEETKMIQTQLKQKTEDQLEQKMMEIQNPSRLVQEIQTQRNNNEQTAQPGARRGQVDASAATTMSDLLLPFLCPAM